jgi:hypothetical protein
MRSRPLPAGPELALEGAQVRKPLALRYALGTSADVDPYEFADRVWSPLLPVDADGSGDLPASGSHVRLQGIAVDAVVREDGALLVRGHEPHGRDGELVIEGRTGTVVDLRGRFDAAFDGRLALRPHQIVTVRLDD